MARLLRVPEISAGTTEAVLAAWPLAEKARYAATDVIATVETEKAIVEVAAEEDGVILRKLVSEGANVAVGQPIAVVGAPGEQADDVEELLHAEAVTAGAAPEPAVSPPAAGAPAPAVPSAKGAPVPAASVAAGTSVTGNGDTLPAGARPDAQRIFVSPLARRLAREADVDLNAISGTGPHGRIVRRDVERTIRTAGPAATAAPDGMPAPARYTSVPHSRLRRAVAGRLTESKQSVPHFYVSGTARADKLLQLRAELNAGPATARISVNDLIIKAVARAHQIVPAMNVIWTPDALLSYPSVDVGVAIASPRGLVTPVLRSVEQHTISALAAAVADLVDRAGDGRLQQRELEGGTICVSNLGMYGVEQFSAIINPPQSSILAAGAVHEAPVVHKGNLRVGSVLRVTLSADHRAVDGTTAAEWMKAFVAVVEHPAQILA